MPMQFRIAVLAAALAFGALVASAGAAPMPPPSKPLVPARAVAPDLYSGRWYEIARTPNRMQSDCQASTMDFGGAGGTSFSVVDTCHKGSPFGPTQTLSASGHIMPASSGAKMKLGMMGGLITKEYWVLECAQNNGWAIMSTPDGSYVWLLSRQPQLPAAERTRALAHLKALGFDLTRLAYPQQPPA
jgi:apolipoprotein D and lipocalin family protein